MNLAYLSSKVAAYWRTPDGRNHVALRKRGYRGAFQWTYTSPDGNERPMRTSEVADAMSRDSNAYGL